VVAAVRANSPGEDTVDPSPGPPANHCAPLAPVRTPRPPRPRPRIPRPLPRPRAGGGARDGMTSGTDGAGVLARVDGTEPGSRPGICGAFVKLRSSNTDEMVGPPGALVPPGVRRRVRPGEAPVRGNAGGGAGGGNAGGGAGAGAGAGTRSCGPEAPAGNAGAAETSSLFAVRRRFEARLSGAGIGRTASAPSDFLAAAALGAALPGNGTAARSGGSL